MFIAILVLIQPNLKDRCLVWHRKLSHNFQLLNSVYTLFRKINLKIKFIICCYKLIKSVYNQLIELCFIKNFLSRINAAFFKYSRCISQFSLNLFIDAEFLQKMLIFLLYVVFLSHQIFCTKHIFIKIFFIIKNLTFYNKIKIKKVKFVQ